jgi:hypothetical protein
MVYVDLNPLRAGMAARLEECAFTSILQRMRVVKAAEPEPAKPRSTERPSKSSVSLIASLLLPIESNLTMSTRQYISLVARTGGVPIDEDSHGDRLVALGIDPPRWEEVLNRTGALFGTAVGNTVNLLKEAARRGARRVINPIDVYAA